MIQLKRRGPILLKVLMTALALSLSAPYALAEMSLETEASLEVPNAKTYQPLKLAVYPTVAPSQERFNPNAERLPVQADFTPDEQRQTYLTQFIMSYNKRLNWEEANLIADAIVEFSNRYQVDFRLVTGVIAVESSFRTDAISRTGAIGLGQLKPKTAQWLGVVNPFDPIDNVAGMSRYLKYLISKYNGSLDHALSAYFQGPGTIDREGISEMAKGYLYRVNTVLSRM